MAEQKDILTDHAYDGIQEFDNPTPGWWTWIFILSIVFSACYFLLVTVLGGGQLSPIAGYDRAYTADLRKQFAAFGELKPDGETILRLAHDEKALKVGESIYVTNCVSCHARDGTGISGPNMTDDAYLNVVQPVDLIDVVTKGRKNGAMPAWANRLQPNEIVVVSSYVASLRGKNLPGKTPEGNVAPEWK
jgi:cytochrome c oxidase cbb3-type subunit 3